MLVDSSFCRAFTHREGVGGGIMIMRIRRNEEEEGTRTYFVSPASLPLFIFLCRYLSLSLYIPPVSLFL